MNSTGFKPPFGRGTTIGDNYFVNKIHFGASLTTETNCTINDNVQIEMTGVIGEHTNIGRDSKFIIKGKMPSEIKFKIGDYSTLGVNTSFILTKYSINTGKKCTIEDDVQILMPGYIGSNTIIGSGCKFELTREYETKKSFFIGDFTKLGEHTFFFDEVTIANNVNIGKHVILKNAEVGANAIIEDECFIDKNAEIGPSAKVSRNAYIGNSTEIMVNVGKSAIIHNHVKILEGEHIKANEIVIRSPSTYDLFLMCAPFDQISKQE